MVTKTEIDITEVWKAFKEDQSSQELRNKLIERYLPLVRYNAERVWARLPDGVDLHDLISAGVFGLMDAIDAFDMGRGVKFETYCVPRIRGAMLDELRTMDWVPRLVRSKASKLEAARKQARSGTGSPSRGQRSGRASCRFRWKNTIAEIGGAAVGLVSLNKKWYETDSYKDVREIDILEDKQG
jgi:RNA polymerase sigma factor for flagellar operon FliA